MIILLYILAAFALLILLLLYLRVHLAITLMPQARRIYLGNFLWSIRIDSRGETRELGLAGIRLSTINTNVAAASSVAPETRKQTQEEKQAFAGIGLDLALELLRHAVRLIRRLFRQLRVDYFRCRLVVATADPMITGVVFGVLIPLQQLNRLPRTSIAIEPDFGRERPLAELDCSISVRPLFVIFVILIAAARLPWFKIIRALRQRRAKMELAGSLSHG